MKRNLLSLFLIVAFAAFPAYSAVVRPYPGLTQVRYTCPDKSTPNFTIDFSTIASNLTDRTKGCIMGNKSWARGGSSVLSDASESFTGTRWYWSDLTTYGYEGEILLDAGTTITIGGCFDDGSAYFIDGTQVFNQGAKSGYDQLTPAESYTATYSGWHPFRAFVWDWSYGKDICRGALAALQWNTNGVTDITKTTSWNKFVCGDDMTFLRTLVKDPSMSYIAVNSYTVSAADNIVTTKITFTAPVETTVTIYSGISDCGDSTNGWNTTTEFQIPADCGATNLVFPAVPGADTIFRVYISGSDDAGAFFEWSDAKTVEKPASIPTQPALALINPAFSTADLSCLIESFGEGYSSVDVSAIIATDADFTQNVTTAAFCTLTETFVTVTNAVSGLAPSTTYYVMLRAVNGGAYFAISDEVSFTTLERPYTYEDKVSVTGEAGAMTAAAEITGVYDGVTVAVSVFVNNDFKQSWALTEPGTCSYTDATLTRDDYIYYTLTTELNNVTYPVRVEYSRVLYVSVDGDDANSGLTLNNPKATVQSALDAVTEDIERIIVQPGTYTNSQAILVTNAVTVIGQGESREDVIFSGAGVDRIMIMSNANAVVSGITLTGGRAAFGAGIYLQAGLLTNCIVSGNEATDQYASSYTAGGIFMLNSASARVVDCLITNNKGMIGKNGVAIASPLNDGKAVVSHCTISSNEIKGNGSGGGIVYRVLLTDCVFTNNTVDVTSITGGCALECQLYRCIFRNNSGGSGGNGVAIRSSTVYDSLIVGTTSLRNDNGTVADSTCYNCTIVDNSSSRADHTPGVYKGKLYNCILWGNTNTVDSVIRNYKSDSAPEMYYTCTYPYVSSTGNIEQDPALNPDYTLGASPCINSGRSDNSTYFPNGNLRTTDLAGNPRVAMGAVDMGCYEKQTYDPGLAAATISSTPMDCPIGTNGTFRGIVKAAAGTAVTTIWDFGDGTIITNTLTTTVDSQTVTVDHTYVSGGRYGISFTVQTGSVENGDLHTSVAAFDDFVRVVYLDDVDIYVSTTGSDDNDGLSVDRPKATVKEALKSLAAAGTIHVAPGTYGFAEELTVSAGKRIIGEADSREDVIFRRTGSAAYRLLTVSAADAVVSGVTLENGHSLDGSHYGSGVNISKGLVTNCIIRNCTSPSGNSRGGGVCLRTSEARLVDCVVSNNFVYHSNVLVGGGIYSEAGYIANCLISGNIAAGGGAGIGCDDKTDTVCVNSVIENNACRENSTATTSRTSVGSGVVGGIYSNCIIRGNWAYQPKSWDVTWDKGGAVHNAELYNCLVVENGSYYTAGVCTFRASALIDTTAVNCTIANNIGYYGSGYYGAAVSGGTLKNCIVWDNITTNAAEKSQTILNYTNSPVFYSSCTMPEVSGWDASNMTNNPLLVAMDKKKYQLSPESPCINAGNNSYVDAYSTDLLGSPRIIRTVDLGCFEFSPDLTLILIR